MSECELCERVIKGCEKAGDGEQFCRKLVDDLKSKKISVFELDQKIEDKFGVSMEEMFFAGSTPTNPIFKKGKK